MPQAMLQPMPQPLAAQADASTVVRECERRASELESRLAEAQARLAEAHAALQHHPYLGPLPGIPFIGGGGGGRGGQDGGWDRPPPAQHGPPSSAPAGHGHGHGPAGGPPAMAGPGYRWVLLKEGQEAPGQRGGSGHGGTLQQQQHQHRRAPSWDPQQVRVDPHAGTPGALLGRGVRVSLLGAPRRECIPTPELELEVFYTFSL